MAAKEILLLGNENLYNACHEVSKAEIAKAKQVAQDLHDTILSFRKNMGLGGRSPRLKSANCIVLFIWILTIALLFSSIQSLNLQMTKNLNYGMTA